MNSYLDKPTRTLSEAIKAYNANTLSPTFQGNGADMLHRLDLTHDLVVYQCRKALNLEV